MKTNENIAEILGEKASFYLDHVCEKITKDELQTPSKTSIDKIAGRDLVSLILFPSHGQIELSGFGYYGTVFPMFTISAIYITMPATCT